MQKQVDGQTTPAGMPNEEAMRLISRYAKTLPEPEQVYCFAVRLCDNDIDRDHERFDDQALRDMAPLFEGKAGLFDHQWSAKQQVARLYKAEVVVEAGKATRDGRPYQYLKGYAYMLRGESCDALIADIEGGIKREVSVGLSCSKATCSLCGRVWGQCDHVKGHVYDGYSDIKCHVVLSEPTDAYEWSFVAVPAQREAGVMKQLRAESGELRVDDQATKCQPGKKDDNSHLSTLNSQPNNKGGNTMATNLEELKTENPALYDRVMAEAQTAVKPETVIDEKAVSAAVDAERKRMSEIDGISALFGDDLVREAKYGDRPCDARELSYRAAVDAAKKGRAFMADMAADNKASGAAGVSAAAAAGGDFMADGAAGVGDTPEQKMANARAEVKTLLGKAKEGK